MSRHEHRGHHEHRAEADAESVRGWFTGRLPQEWFTGPVEVTVDREEITVVYAAWAVGLLIWFVMRPPEAPRVFFRMMRRGPRNAS